MKYAKLPLMITDCQIIILAAGKGTRMKTDLPKVLVPLAGKPLISRLLESVEQAVVHKPHIVIGYGREHVQDALGDGHNYAIQEEQKGTAHAALQALPEITAPYVMVLLGDMPLVSPKTIAQIIASHKDSGAPTTLPTVTVPHFDDMHANFKQFARIIRNEDGDIVAIREFKDTTPQEQALREVNPAFHVFNTDWLRENIERVSNQNAQNELYLTDMIRLAVERGDVVNTLSIEPKEALGANTPEELQVLERFI